jgi:hypothetical protein
MTGYRDTTKIREAQQLGSGTPDDPYYVNLPTYVLLSDDDKAWYIKQTGYAPRKGYVLVYVP